MSYEDVRKQLSMAFSKDPNKSDGYNTARQQLVESFGGVPPKRPGGTGITRKPEPVEEPKGEKESLFGSWLKNLAEAGNKVDTYAGYMTDDVTIANAKQPTTERTPAVGRLADRWQNAIDTNPRTSVSTGSQFMGGGQPIQFEEPARTVKPGRTLDQVRAQNVEETWEPGEERARAATQPISFQQRMAMQGYEEKRGDLVGQATSGREAAIEAARPYNAAQKQDQPEDVDALWAEFNELSQKFMDMGDGKIVGVEDYTPEEMDRYRELSGILQGGNLGESGEQSESFGKKIWRALTDKILGIDENAVTGEKTDWLKLLGGTIVKGANQINASLWRGVDFLFGDAAQQIHALGVETINGIISGLNMIPGADIAYLGEGTNAISSLTESAVAGQNAANAEYYANANTSRAAQVVDKFGTSFVAAVPMALEAMFLGYVPQIDAAARGLDLASPVLSSANTAGLTYFSGLQSATGLEQIGMMAKAGQAAMLQNPMFWTSYLQAVGDGFENVQGEEGMSDMDKGIYALVNGYFNAMIEIGGADEALGGIQNLPMRLQDALESGNKYAVVDWFKDSVLGEGWEEVQQGAFERGFKAPSTGAPMFSLDPNDENAVINPYTAADEFFGGAVVGGLLGGGEVALGRAVESARNAAQRRAETEQALQEGAQTEEQQEAPRPTREARPAIEEEGRAEAQESRPEPHREARPEIEEEGRTEAPEKQPEPRTTVEEQRAAIEEKGAAEETMPEAQQITQEQSAQAVADEAVEEQAEPTEEKKKQNRTETMRGILNRASSAAGVEMSDADATVIAEGYEAGTKGSTYAAAATDAYKLGKSGQYTLEEAMKVSRHTADISAEQFRKAFETGAGAASAEADTVDASTEEGRQALTAALSSLGDNAEDAASAYEAGQDVSRFAAGMSEAAERYAVTGTDIRAQGGVPADSVISTLTDAQIEKAQEIGGRLRAQRAAAISQLAEQRKAIRAQARAIERQNAADADALTEINRQIREANKLGKDTVALFKAQREAITKAVETDPNFQNTKEYAKAFDEAKANMEKAQDLQRAVENLNAKKKALEAKKPTARKKGTVNLNGGNIAGTEYKGIDRGKLTRQQQNIVAMVERLADIINIDYVLFDGPANMGGAYMQGGRIFININAGMTKAGRKSIAAASLSHELTHFMQEYAPEEYRQLKDYVIGTILNKSQAEFDRLVRQQRRWEPGKSYDELADEMVANACQTMLTDDKAVQRMARSNMSLAQRVADVLDEIGEKIRKAFEGLSFDEDRAIFAPVKAVMDEIDGITDRWADGISAAVENYNAEQTVRQAEGNKNTASEGVAQYQFAGERAENADREALSRAVEMELNGAGNEELRQETGWFRGMDGKWRFEIQDYEARFSKNGDIRFAKDHPEYARYIELTNKFIDGTITAEEAEEAKRLARTWGPEQKRLADMLRSGRTSLDMVLDHPTLFEAYPELRSVKVVYADMGAGAKGSFDPKTNTISLSKDADSSTLFHEIQHAIQEIEGFSKGASIEYWQSAKRKGDLQAYPAELRTEVERIYSGIQQIENEVPGITRAAWLFSPEEMEDKFGRTKAKEITDLVNRRSAIYYEARGDYDLYANTAGEIEARDAAFRSSFVNERQYRGIKPNLGNGDTVFADDNGGNKVRNQTWDESEYKDLTQGLSEDDVYELLQSKREELRFAQAKIKERRNEDLDQVDKVMNGDLSLDEYNSWREETGLARLQTEADTLDKETRMLAKRYDELVDQRLESEEKESIEKSGLSEAEYFGKEAVKAFGYTPYYYDAGYIVPNGKMLNFSGEKGKHFGSRGEDHRAIGQIFATTKMSDAMIRFMSYGNIRIMAESPGLDVSTAVKPTTAQYSAIRSFVRSVSDEGYFALDFTDENGRTIGSLEYDDAGRVNPARVVADIQRYFETGKVPEVGMRYQFQTWDDTTDDTSSESRGRDIAYARLQSENAILTETVAAMKKLTGKQGKTIAALQKRLQVTTTPEVRQSDARKLSRQLIRDNGSKADAERVSEQIKALGDYILQTDTAKLDENEMKSRARAIASEILNSATEQINVEDDTFQRIAGEIKGRKLSIDEDFLGELDQAGGYDAFRKSVFGSFTLAKRDSASRETRDGYMTVDQFYTDMQGQYGKGLFPDAANEGEQVQTIAHMLDAAKPMEVNPFEQYMGEATEELANRIVMDAMNGVLRQTAPTTADRQKARTQALKEQIDRLKAENKLEQREAASLYHTVYDLTVALDKASSKYQTLRTEADYRAAQLRAEGTARAAEIKAAERMRADSKIKALREYYQLQRQRATEMRNNSANATKYRKQITKKVGVLRDMLVTNSDKVHVPEVLKAPLSDFLSSIDLSSKSLLNLDTATKADEKNHAAFLKLVDLFSRQQEYIDGNGNVQGDLGGYLDISSDSMEFLRGTATLIYEAMQTGQEYTINRMNAEQLKDLSNFLSNLTKAIRDMNNFMANARYESVQSAARTDIEGMKALGKASEISASAAVRFAGWENGTPYYIMKRLGNGAKSIFDGFAKGWERLAFNAQEIIDFTEKLYTDKEVRDWKRTTHDITLEDGSKIKMTTAQIMELSMLLGREQAVKHISRGGIRIGDIETKKGKIHDTAHYHLSDADIKTITGMLTERQSEVAKAMQRFMADRGAEWGNEVSMRRFGYKFYEEGPGYYPIKTDSNDRPMADTDAQTNSMFRLLNLSASKSLNPRASNALVVGDIFDTFADHMADMAKLNGMGLPILDAIKWFNYKERVNYEDGTYDTITLQGAMEEAFGEQAQRYFRTLMKDINGVNESGDRGTSLPTKMMSNYKIAAVAANLRVAFLQPTSYIRATTVLKPKYMAGIVPSKAAYREAMKYSGTAVWKSLGYYETDISKSMRGQITHDDSFRDKVADKSMALAELGDQATWSMLWQACRKQAKAESPSLSQEALMEKTTDLFREVVYSSQVMDSTLTRSEIMRGKTGWTKAMSAFMAEPTLSYNILMDAASEYNLDVRKNGKAGAWKRNSGKIGKAVTVYVASAAFAAVVESIADAVRDDDDEEFWEKFKQALWGEKGPFSGNLVQDLTILGKLPYVKNFISTLQGYTSGDMSVAAFNNLVNVYKIWEETIKLQTGALEKATKVTSYGKMTEWGKVYKTLQALSQLSGFAVSNLTRDATAIWNTAMDVAGKQEWKIRTYNPNALSQSKTEAYEQYVKNAGISKKQYEKILSDANLNGGTVSQDEMGSYLTDALRDKDLTKAQAVAVWTSLWNSPSSKTYDKWLEGKTKEAAKPKDDAYASYTKNVSIYDKDGAYEGWKANLEQWGVGLDEFTNVINKANTDGNSSIKQDELGEYLYNQIQNKRMTEEEANAWFLVFWNGQRSKTYTKWAAKNKK